MVLRWILSKILLSYFVRNPLVIVFSNPITIEYLGFDHYLTNNWPVFLPVFDQYLHRLDRWCKWFLPSWQATAAFPWIRWWDENLLMVATFCFRGTNLEFSWIWQIEYRVEFCFRRIQLWPAALNFRLEKLSESRRSQLQALSPSTIIVFFGYYLTFLFTK